MPERLTCPACRGSSFSVKYEASYVYSYIIDEDTPGLKNTTELLPFMFDKREQKESKQFLECNCCGVQYPFFYNKDIGPTDTEAIQKAINSHFSL